ncbi:Por secretion system C-terminal sorting domain-containing protein [Tenacibaculum sp. MAR_2009_124]|uniref:fibronectin type III domain-containing protein n=1 Tax=Tenacibaculum sp. MAR_2009_124 TaxID=1250059 RepID=UPI000898FA46|nr:GEVED domain-containing protein [Tenacibaculum sp. MAR_2009_124]SEC39874.1 Por secretion system C-terminal sorting domain-containing protein [Tenacibaculum sp. MAR_2009_124]
MNIKFRVLIGGLSLAAISITGSKYLKEQNARNEITEKREMHSSFMNKSPLNETLKWGKKERKLKGLPPNRYFDQMELLTMNPATGKMEDGSLTGLREQLLQERILRQNNQRSTPGETGNSWVERGPNNVGGRTRVILFDPNDASNNTVYAGGVSGGLWKNTNITSSNSQWSRVQNVPGNLSVTSITIDPRNSNRWYVGTGEQYTAGDVVGNGVYVTNDGGTTWNAVNIPAAGGADINHNASNVFLSGIHYVNDVLAWDNGTGTELFVAVGAHVYGDSSSPRNWLGLQSAGLYRSTDGGTTWGRLESANMKYTFGTNDYYYIPNDLEVGADNKLWMGTIQSALDANSGGRVFSSTNGGTWTEAAASPLSDSNRVELEPSATNGNKIYALTQGTVNTAPVHIYKTTNGFASVTSTSLPNDADSGIPANDFCRGQAFYDLVIEADPTNDNVVYVGGIDLFKTTNGGTSWSQLSHWYGGFGHQNVHADQHSIAFGNNNSSRMLFGNDGGVYYTGNAGGTISVRNRGYNVTQFVKAGIGPDGAGDTGGIFTAGAQDNGTQAFRNPTAGINSSTFLSDGDGFYTFVDKDGDYMIATYVRNVIYRFNLPWNGLGRQQGGATTLLNEQGTGDFVNPMGYDDSANRLLTNASTDTAKSIKSINVAANSKGNITNTLLDASPTAFIASPFANNTWYVGLSNGKLLMLTNVTNSNATWASISAPFIGSVSSVRFGATANDIFVTIHNYGVTSIWATADGGANWVSKEGNLPNIPVRDFLQNPLSRNEAIIATQLGVWSTSNFNDVNPTWDQAYNGMSDVSVTSFDYWNVSGDHTNNKIIASTYGRGVFTGEFTSSNSTPDTQAPTVPTNVTASSVTATGLALTWTASTDNIAVTEYDIYQDATKIGTSTSPSYNVTGLTASTNYTFSIKAKDAAGNESTASNNVSVTTSSAPSISCTSTISNFPYGQGFESGNGWTQATGDDGNWVRKSGSTPSSGTGPTSANEGTYYMFLEASTNNSAGQIGANATAILESPCIDLTSVTSATFSFKNHMFGNNIGVLTVQGSSDGTTWTNLWTASGSKGNQWNSESVDLASYAGSTIKLRIVGKTGNGWSSDIAIDDLSVTASGGSDTQAPTAPGNLTSSNIAQTTLSLTWTASTDNVGVTGYDVYQGTTKIASTATASYNVTGLTANTAYTFSVKATDAAGNESNSSNVVNATTLGNVVSYCASKGNRVSYEWIDYVSFGGMTNTSAANGGYGDFTNKVATVTRGTTNQILVSAGFRNSAYTEYFTVWIDYNQNGTFESNEQTSLGSSNTATNRSANISIPASANLGQTRMRVSMKYNAASTACEAFPDGEVEDYTVNITNSATAVATISSDEYAESLDKDGLTSLTVYPNPAINHVIVRFGSNENVNYRITNTIGQIVQQGNTINNAINITELQHGVYVLEANDGQKSITTKLVKR